MALKENIQTFTYNSEDGATNGIGERLFVAPSAVARRCKLPVANGDPVIGVTVYGSTGPNQAMCIAADGIVKVTAGATLAAGAEVMAATTGRAIAALAAKNIAGIVVTGGGNNDVIEVHLRTAVKAV